MQDVCGKYLVVFLAPVMKKQREEKFVSDPTWK